MNYQLMHKEIPVASFVLDDATAAILRISELYHPEHLPVGIAYRKGIVDRAALNNWWQGRAIPASRQGLRAALTDLNIEAPQALLEKCLGLSLSDQYWIRPVDSTVRWADVNFFTHSFSDDVGNALLGKGMDSNAISLMSPDNTSDGWLRKKWSIIDGKRCLLKGGSGATQQEPYNEVFASTLMKRLGIPNVSYTLSLREEYPYSVCGDFITPDTELVSAWHIMQTQKKKNDTSVYQHFMNCCEALGIPNVKCFIDQMLVADYLLVNEDRHLNNFGAIRNAETLEWIGLAPLYDSGTSLWFDTPTAMIRGAAAQASCKPFKTSHEEQIKLVPDFSWVNWAALNGIEDEFRAIAKGSAFVDIERCNAICRGIIVRVQMLHAHASKGNATKTDDLASDVQRNIAFSNPPEE